MIGYVTHQLPTILNAEARTEAAAGAVGAGAGAAVTAETARGTPSAGRLGARTSGGRRATPFSRSCPRAAAPRPLTRV